MKTKSLAKIDEETQVKIGSIEKVEAALYRRYKVSLEFRDRIYGGLPKSPKLITNYIEGKFGKENGDLAEKLKAEVDIVEEEEKISTGFKRDSHGLYISDYQIKALLKEAASVSKVYMQKRGSKQVFQHGIFIKPPTVHLGTMTAHGTQEFTGHVMTPRGKRSIIKQADYVERTRVSFDVWLLRDHVVNSEDLRKCFIFGQELGLGACRSFESGKYNLVVFKELD